METKIHWHTTTTCDGDDRQHAYISCKKDSVFTGLYEGNRTLCDSRRGVFEIGTDKYLPLEEITNEKTDATIVCRKCLRKANKLNHKFRWNIRSLIVK